MSGFLVQIFHISLKSLQSQKLNQFHGDTVTSGHLVSKTLVSSAT